MNQDRKYSLIVTILCILLLIALCGLYLLGLQQYKLKEYLPIMQAVGIIQDNYFYYDDDSYINFWTYNSDYAFYADKNAKITISAIFTKVE